MDDLGVPPILGHLHMVRNYLSIYVQFDQKKRRSPARIRWVKWLNPHFSHRTWRFIQSFAPRKHGKLLKGNDDDQSLFFIHFFQTNPVKSWYKASNLSDIFPIKDREPIHLPRFSNHLTSLIFFQVRFSHFLQKLHSPKLILTLPFIGWKITFILVSIFRVQLFIWCRAMIFEGRKHIWPYGAPIDVCCFRTPNQFVKYPHRNP